MLNDGQRFIGKKTGLVEENRGSMRQCIQWYQDEKNWNESGCGEDQEGPEQNDEG